MSNDHFGVPFVTSFFYRIIWKIIINIFEEARNYFTEIAEWILLSFNGCLLLRSRSIYMNKNNCHS